MSWFCQGPHSNCEEDCEKTVGECNPKTTASSFWYVLRRDIFVQKLTRVLLHHEHLSNFFVCSLRSIDIEGTCPDGKDAAMNSFFDTYHIVSHYTQDMEYSDTE